MLQSKNEIIQASRASFINLIDWLEVHPADKFLQGPVGKWNASQHIDHLTVVNKQLKTGISMPKFILRYKFGKPNRPARNYEQIVQRYQKKLADIGPDFQNPSGGKSASSGGKSNMMAAYQKTGEVFLKKLGKWKEKDLDKYLLPHPLMGRMTVRELMLWSIYHTEHHLKNLKENY